MNDRTLLLLLLLSWFVEVVTKKEERCSNQSGNKCKKERNGWSKINEKQIDRDRQRDVLCTYKTAFKHRF